MFAVMVPVSSFAAGSSYLIAGLFLAVLLLANLPKDVPVRRLVYAGLVACVLAVGATTANIMVPCQYWWFC